MSKWPGSLPPASQGGRQLWLNSRGRGWGMVLCVTVVKLGDWKSGSRPLFFFRAFISALGGESSPSQTCPFLGRLPSGMTPRTAGLTGCPLPKNPAPQAGAGGTSQSPCKQALQVAMPSPGGRPPSPAPSPPGAPCTGIPAAHAPRSGALVSHSLSAAGSRRPLGWVKRPLGPLRGWWSRAGRAGQSQEHFGGGRGF